MNALVLSGGSIKGAFQAGAVSHLLQAGFVPEMVYGISVGALNAAFLADRSGRRVHAGQPVDWKQIADELERFWLENVTRPEDLIRKRGILDLGFRILKDRFRGLTSTEPLQKLVRREALPENLRATPLKFFVGAVNMIDGGIHYSGPDSPHIVDAIIASAAIPIMMPMIEVGGEPHYDGGIRDIAPLGTAINAGATRIACVICDPAQVTRRDFERGDLLELAGRLMEIVTNETLENDLKIVRHLNRLVEQVGPEATERYQKIPALAVRPERTIPVAIDSFRRDDIRRMIELGREQAGRALAENPEWMEGGLPEPAT